MGGELVGRAVARRALLALFAAVLLAPLAFTLGVATPHAESRVTVFADALGFAALSLLALQVVTSGRWAATTRHFGLRLVLALHRSAGKAVLLLVVVHLALLLLDDPARLALLDVRDAPGRARAGVLALLALLVIAATSTWREQLRLGYERWRALHLGLTAVVLAASFLHVVWVDAYSSLPAVRWSVLTLVLGAAVALFWARVAQPYASATRPYRVAAVRPERGRAVTVELVPDGGHALRFAPGQFARLRGAHAPYGLDDHPFTLSTSAEEPGRPGFTVKALGDYSTAVAGLAVGTAVLVDGPHGEAVDEQPGRRGRLLVAAGIGITPAMSVLRTAAARGDDRPVVLLYGSRTWEEVTFREELADLARRLPALRVVDVLSRPSPGWFGERGRVDAALLRRHAPADVARWSALVCGPPALVAGTTSALVALGMPASAVQAEGFA